LVVAGSYQFPLGTMKFGEQIGMENKPLDKQSEPLDNSILDLAPFFGFTDADFRALSGCRCYRITDKEMELVKLYYNGMERFSFGLPRVKRDFTF
jgi:hypothetical protein